MTVRFGGRSKPVRVLIWIALWTGLGLFFASEAAMRQFPGQQESLPWSDALLINIPFYLIWGILALGVVRLARLFPFAGTRRERIKSTLLHLAAGFAVALLHIVLAETVFEAIRLWRGRPIPYSAAFVFSLRHNFHINLLTYWAIVAVLHLRDYDRGLREKELNESRLQEQLANAELAALRMQLQPHFLFNALHSISSLLYADPEAADRMLVRLSDLLRQSFETNGQQIVRLEQELDFVSRYLEIERMRYSDRLEVAVYVDPLLYDAAVPAFLLQPLVENAVVHGVGPSRGPCKVTVRAIRDAEELVLDVENDVPEPTRRRTKARSGVGLQNTRARLEQLYGAGARLDLELGADRQARTRVVLPFRELESSRAVL